MLNVVSLLPPALIPLIVYTVTVEGSVAVPEIEPSSENIRPLGRSGEIVKPVNKESTINVIGSIVTPIFTDREDMA